MTNDADQGMTSERAFNRPSRKGPAASIYAEATPLPLAGKDRAAWRVCMACLCLSKCRGRSATVAQLNTLIWAVTDEENFEQFLRVWEGKAIGVSIRRLDANLEDTLRLGKAAGLTTQAKNGRQVLTSVGENLIKNLVQSGETSFEVENKRLSQLGSITEKEMWTRLDSRREKK